MARATDANPFLRHRRHLDAYAHARNRGWSDARWTDVVAALDERLADIDGTGFVVTPLLPIETPVGRAWAKVETAGVSGSHKARHLFGLALDLLVAGELGDRASHGPELAIASCGNAALAAATVARALDRPLRVFVPATADPAVVRRLEHLGAAVTISDRRPGERGDPCVRDLRRAVQGGAVPFTVQGTVCPGAFDGARTIGLELAEQLAAAGAHARHLFVQVGGGALATATMEGLDRAGASLPALHPVQARSAHPFVAAWERLAAWRAARPEPPDPLTAGAEVAALMEPWPSEPTSVATGILDDVTYDWLPVASWTLRTGGSPVLVDEATFAEAAALAAARVAPPPDATGAAGLAGLLSACRAGGGPAGEAVVLLTGVDRRWEAAADPLARRRVVPADATGDRPPAGPVDPDDLGQV